MKIAVPKPPKSAFNPERPISDLVRWQLRHMHEAEKRLPAHERTGQAIEAIKTEGEASAYLREMTDKLHGPYKVRVPKPPAAAFNQHRKISDLIRGQVEHFHEAELRLPQQLRTGADVKSIKTEHQAASYIAKMTAILHGTGISAAVRPRESSPASDARVTTGATASRTPPKKTKSKTSSTKKRRRKA